MIRIKKLYIENFKGIKGGIYVDLEKDESQNQILSGPNGFGKTTIFESLELCLVGRFDRVQVFKDVQLKTKNRSRPFFQNEIGKDVVIKLMVEKDEEKWVIIKHYDVKKSPTKKASNKDFLPEDAHNIFQTYLTQKSIEDNDFEESEIVDQKSINNFFLGDDTKVELGSLYYLFNYIQQEESIRFLKLKEDNKGASLSFLFNIEQEEADSSKLDEIVKKLQKQQDSFKGELDALELIESNGDVVEYYRVFEDLEIDFDNEEPFKNLEHSKEMYPIYLERLNELIEFRSIFKTEEYKKSKIFEDLNTRVINQEQTLNSLLVSKLYTSDFIEKVEENNKIIHRYQKFLESKEDTFIPEEIRKAFFSDDQNAKYLLLEQNIKSIDSDLGKIGTIVSKLIDSNKNVWESYSQSLEHDHLEDNHCPLCYSVFDNYEMLLSAYKEQLDNLARFNKEKIENKQEFLKDLKTFHQQIRNEIAKFLNRHKKVEESVISLLRNYPNVKAKVDNIIERFMTEEYLFSDEYLFQSLPNTIDDFDSKRTELNKFFETSVLDKFRFDQSKIENKHLFEKYFQNNEELFEKISQDQLIAKRKYIEFKRNLLSHQRVSFLKERHEKIELILSKLSPINDKVIQGIKDHKIDMINKIKIPFFLYSGKILQNYQQGFGVFIDISATASRNNVVLRTGNESDHDIVFHLSAGQMAVVSLAFCLSLNKVYNTNENIKLLAIDDPIQTMDNLNVHSFIELLRNEFSDYQIILSTHDEFIARYMSYKFEKFNINTSIQNVQDLVLEQTLN